VIDASCWTRVGILRDADAFFEEWEWIDSQGDVRSMVCNVDTLPGTRTPTVCLLYDRDVCYTYESLAKRIQCRVELVTTRPHFGGLRWWFICPLTSNGIPCRRRVQCLYLPPDQTFFGCRFCHRLGYQSKLENASDRALRKARKMRARLGRTATGDPTIPPRPKGMWRRTYQRRVEQANEVEDRGLQQVADKLGISLEELKDYRAHGHDDNSDGEG